MAITMEMRNAFFDRKKVQDAFDKATRRAIVKSLAFVRRRQRSSIRRRKRISRPGEPPSAHSSDRVATVKNILFAYDQRTQSGVVGMVNLNGRRSNVNSNQELPDLLESGGPMRIPVMSYDGRTWFAPAPRRAKRIKRDRPWVKQRKRTARMRPRPSAGPALQHETEAGNILSPWADVVSG
jgi:hypothetical protein